MTEWDTWNNDQTVNSRTLTAVFYSDINWYNFFQGIHQQLWSNCACIPSFRESTSSSDQIGLCQLSQLTNIDLSYNFLVGDVPACLQQIQRYTFAVCGLKCFTCLPELTCFTVFEQIKLGRELLPEQHIKPPTSTMYGDILNFNFWHITLIQFVPIFLSVLTPFSSVIWHEHMHHWFQNTPSVLK
jgi:hypothetical protein